MTVDWLTHQVAEAERQLGGNFPGRASTWRLHAQNGHLGFTSEVPVSIGGPSRTRTLDPLIKRRGPVMSRPSSFFAHLRVIARSA
jgi:hypothetical protein